MTTWYEASQGVVEAANNAMGEVAAGSGDHNDKVERIRAIWEPIALALCESCRGDLDEDEVALAKRLDTDFVGMTSDTRKMVSWGTDGQYFRPFHIHEFAE